MNALKNAVNAIKLYKENHYDFFESVLIFFGCLVASFTILFIHASYFTPYFQKTFLVEFSFSITMVTGLLMIYEGHLMKKNV